jgi:hypothetical protein
MTGRALAPGDDSSGGRVLRLAEWLIGQACRGLPDPAADERYREWTAELPAILHDPAVRFAPCRAARALLFAADQRRGTRPARQTRAADRTRITRSGKTAYRITIPIRVAGATSVAGAVIVGAGVSAYVTVGGSIDILGVVLAVVGIGIGGGFISACLYDWMARRRGSGGRTPDGGVLGRGRGCG